jgi:uncharacterized protein YxeA
MAWTPPPPPGSKPTGSQPTAQIPPPPSPPPPTPASPPRPVSKISLIVAALIAVAALGGYWFYKNTIDVPRAGDIQKLIENQLSRPNLTIESISTKTTQKNGNREELEYTAIAKLSAAEYQKITLNSYLLDHGANPDVARQIGQIMARPNIKEILAAAQIETPLPDIQDKVLIKQVAPAGQKITYSGHATAMRDGNGWHSELSDAPKADQKPPDGLRLEEFSGDVLDVDKAEASADLGQFLKNANQDVLKKLTGAMEQIQAKRLGKYLAKLQPGALFKGTATKDDGSMVVLYLEISKLDTESQTITAALRNDGGWDDYRRLQGTYAFLENKGEFILKLGTRSEQAVQNCGSFLEWSENFEISFLLDDDVLTAAPKNWGTRYEFKLNWIPSTEKENVIAKATKTQQEWLDATAVNKKYAAHVTLPSRAWSRQYYLVFTKQERNGASAVLGGIVEFPEQKWRRPFSGLLVLNKYRAEGAPLRLLWKAQNNNVAMQLDEQNPFACGSDIELYPQLDEGNFTCETHRGSGRDWHWEFNPFNGNIPALSSGNEEAPGTTQNPTTSTNAVQISGVFWKNGSEEVPLPRTTWRKEVESKSDISILTAFYFRATGAVPKITGNEIVLLHKGATGDLGEKFIIEGDDPSFVIFKLDKDSTESRSFRATGRFDVDLKKMEFDWFNIFGFGKKKVKYELQVIDVQSQNCRITSTLSSGYYAIFDGAAFYVFEYVAPPKK